MSEEDDINRLAASLAPMRRSWRRPVFLGLLIAAVGSCVVLVSEGYSVFDWHVVIAAVVVGLAGYVLLTGYTGKRGFGLLNLRRRK